MRFSVGLACWLVVSAVAPMLIPPSATAMPLFARQTSVSCGMCHAPPPSLTAFGRRFKMSGYSMKSLQPDAAPISVFALTNYSRSSKDFTARPGAHSDTNDNVTLQQVSVVAGGPLGERAGAYVGINYDGFRDEVTLGNVEVRRTDSRYVGNRHVQFAFTVNNNSAYQDPWNSGPLRFWPFLFNLHEPQPNNVVALDGVLTRRVLGATGSAFIDDFVRIILGRIEPAYDV